MVAVTAVAAGTIAAGTIIRQTQGGLGTATPPFVGGYGFAADTGLAAARRRRPRPRRRGRRRGSWRCGHACRSSPRRCGR